MAETETISVENAGPVESLQIPLSADGGVIVLHGMNDAGKSETLHAVQRLLGGDEKVARRYGTPLGVVTGLGASLRLLSNVQQIGECEAWSIEGKLDLATLVDPGVKNPVAADRQRVKALLTVRGVDADPSLFRDLVGGQVELDNIASTGTLAGADLVGMAAGLKKDLEAAARKAEDDAKLAEGEAQASRAASKEIDCSAESDPEKLQTALEGAIAHEAQIKANQSAAVEASQRAEQAKQRVAEAEEKYQGPTVQEAQAVLGSALEKLQLTAEALVTAKAAAQEAERNYQKAAGEGRLAVEHENLAAECKRAIEEATKVKLPSAKALEAAAKTVVEARQDVENGALIRHSQAQAAKAKGHQEAALRLGSRAAKLRAAAHGTDDVLARAIGASALLPVTDEAGRFRLAIPVDKGPTVYYHDLGPGRRWTIALTEGATRLREIGAEGFAILVIPQGAWEGLDWRNRELVDEHVKTLGVTCITAEATKESGNYNAIAAQVFRGEPPKRRGKRQGGK